MREKYITLFEEIKAGFQPTLERQSGAGAPNMRRPRDLTSWDGLCPPSHCVCCDPAGPRLLLAGHGIRIIRRRIAFKPGIEVVCRRN